MILAPTSATVMEFAMSQHANALAATASVVTIVPFRLVPSKHLLLQCAPVTVSVLWVQVLFILACATRASVVKTVPSMLLNFARIFVTVMDLVFAMPILQALVIMPVTVPRLIASAMKAGRDPNASSLPPTINAALLTAVVMASATTASARASRNGKVKTALPRPEARLPPSMLPQMKVTLSICCQI
jgi:hypothetical protein